VLNKIEKEYGLYYNYLNQHSGKWCMKHASMGALADSFYEYLLKLWLYKNKTDGDLLTMYLEGRFICSFTFLLPFQLISWNH
jgi:hypothetical protein